MSNTSMNQRHGRYLSCRFLILVYLRVQRVRCQSYAKLCFVPTFPVLTFASKYLHSTMVSSLTYNNMLLLTIGPFLIDPFALCSLLCSITHSTWPRFLVRL